MIARRHLGHPFPYLFYHTRAFMTEDTRQGDRQMTGPGPKVGVADAGTDDPNQDLIIIRFTDLQWLNIEISCLLKYNRSLDIHVYPLVSDFVFIEIYVQKRIGFYSKDEASIVG
jgi:hypothetical protein